MRVIIAGAGEVGRGVAAALRGEKRGVAMIDPDPNAISDSQSLDCLLITGSALSRDSLVRAGINDAEIIKHYDEIKSTLLVPEKRDLNIISIRNINVQMFS